MSHDGNYEDTQARKVAEPGWCPGCSGPLYRTCGGGTVRYGCFAVFTILAVAIILVIIGVSFSLTDVSILGAVIGAGGLVATVVFIKCHFECCTKRDTQVSISDPDRRSTKEGVKYARRIPSAQPVTLKAFLAMKTQKVGSSDGDGHSGRPNDDTEGNDRGHGRLTSFSSHQEKDTAPVCELPGREDDRATVILVAEGDTEPSNPSSPMSSEENSENVTDRDPSASIPRHGHVEGSEQSRYSSVDRTDENGTKIVFSFQDGLSQTFQCS